MTLPKVSIIIPVWGVEQYVGDCIRSVLMQDYKGSLECIIVNDCTQDDSMAVVEQLLGGYNGKIAFRVLSHKENLGLSAARNTGMAVATGEYLFFLDSDDEITPECISLLASPLALKNYDMVVGGIKEQDTERNRQWLALPDGIPLSPQQIRSAYLEWKWYPMAQNKLYRKDFIVRHSLSFKRGLVHEDELWTAQIAFLLENMYVVSRDTYLYKIRSNSIMTSLDARKDIDAFCQILKELGTFFKCHGLAKDCTANALMIRIFYATIEKQRENGLPFKDVYQQARRSLSLSIGTVFLRSRTSLLGMLINSHLLLSPCFAKSYYPCVMRFVNWGVTAKGWLRRKLRLCFSL